ncbi:hypothetical protein Q2T42_15280 [Leptolyngbya boryana CZ1]|uniref:Uncharacterized protein n=1 Tax=Leptolyngbya boryana CZ1 TaxID=3060204 RepID=A0AA96WS61_LEPBY|nr:hypothetical protein [Leptolyngbya boryana]WNZ43219.1 hypothetical protein Q2T42_15280 [Leptolyngbya boryana CZ1]
MSNNSKAILEAANAAIAQSNYERFLSFCTDDNDPDALDVLEPCSGDRPP